MRTRLCPDLWAGFDQTIRRNKIYNSEDGTYELEPWTDEQKTALSNLGIKDTNVFNIRIGEIPVSVINKFQTLSEVSLFKQILMNT